MSTSSNSSLTYYPAFAHSAHPLHGTNVAITAATLSGLHQPAGYEGQSIYFHLNHPLQHVSLAGVIVSIDESEPRWIIHLDDGSGALAELVCSRASASDTSLESNTLALPNQMIHLGPPTWLGRSKSERDVDMRPAMLGAVVRAGGALGTFRRSMQVLLENIDPLGDTEAEVGFWEETSRTWDAVLGHPWALEQRDLRWLRQEVEGKPRILDRKHDKYRRGEKCEEQPCKNRSQSQSAVEGHTLENDARSEVTGDAESFGERKSLSPADRPSKGFKARKANSTSESLPKERDSGNRRDDLEGRRQSFPETGPQNVNAALEVLGDATPTPSLCVALVDAAWNESPPIRTYRKTGNGTDRSGSDTQSVKELASQKVDVALEALGGAEPGCHLRAALVEAAWADSPQKWAKKPRK